MTGATGLIGRHVVSELTRDWEVYSIERGPERGQLGPIHPIHCDLAGDWDEGRLPGSVDAVIHLAQSEHYQEFPEFAEHMLRVNVISAIRLIEYARRAKARQFILASSGGVYGHGEKGAKEDDPLVIKKDIGFYLGTRLGAEILAQSYGAFTNLIILRFFFVYGPGQGNRMLVPRLVRSCLEGKPILLQGKGGMRCNPTYVTDAAFAVCRALELDRSETINVAGPEVLALRQMADEIGEVTRKRPSFQVEQAEPRHFIGDIEKMQRVLGPPRVRFKDGIRAYIGSLDHDKSE
jgi:nucleoside-diphosphate-sugar epimerase